MSKDGYVYDNWCHLGCGDCKYFQCDAERREDTTCKRIDHKHLQFAVPWFKSYDCGQHSAIKCADFEPASRCKWLCEHWVSIDDYMADMRLIEGHNADRKLTKNGQVGYMGLCIDGDTSVRYYINGKDFYDNTFLNADGSLKWIKRCYYKQSRKSAFGYALVWEFNPNCVWDTDTEYHWKVA